MINPLFRESYVSYFLVSVERMEVNAFPKEVVRLCICIHVESTFLLDVKKWTNMIVGQLSPSIHVDSADPMERLRSEDVSILLSNHS